MKKQSFLLFQPVSDMVTSHVLICYTHFILFFLVLPVYFYQPISFHARAYMLSHVTPWTAARQVPLSMDFPRQEYSSGLPFPSPVTHILIIFFLCSGSLKGFCKNFFVKASHLFLY